MRAGRLAATVMRCWFHPDGLGCRLHALLALPLAWLYGAVVASRRYAYRIGLLSSERVAVPVIVVGNVTAGGTGKTPLTLLLARWLREAGHRPGIISRGYGGGAREAMPVHVDSDVALVGDEPLLMARRAGCPVCIGRARVEAARLLLTLHPEVDVLLADDGLQHYALARDCEIAVVDAARGFGNGRLLPAGPLREPITRLRMVDALVLNGDGDAERVPRLTDKPLFRMTLDGACFVNVRDAGHVVSAAELPAQGLSAVAGIGHPDRFFARLSALGLRFTAHAFPDHHSYQLHDLPSGTVLMTEKDAVKCTRFERDDLWYLAVDANVDAGLNSLLLQRLKANDGPQIA